ncbi:HAD family hydrolase [Streptomyces sp. NPDC057239]|uniref:HAD family hydrolase n=1 Tax=Streptomyces sp. NPDC057239 TaxID=3346061 RepID=UPI00362F0D46
MGNALGEPAVLQDVLRDTRAVLLDFDGPVTRLFGGVSTAPVAQEIKAVVQAAWGTLDPDVAECEDSHGILHKIRDMYDRPAPTPRSRVVLEQAEAIVTRYEYEAAVSAKPAEYFEELVTALRALDLPLAIVSNNAEGPVRGWLESHRRQQDFAFVVGRDPHEIRHMKPHRHLVDRAVQRLGLSPREYLLVGDQMTDLEAARAAGVRFLGYTWHKDRADRMRLHGAAWVLSSHLPLVKAAEALRMSN